MPLAAAPHSLQAACAASAASQPQQPPNYQPTSHQDHNPVIGCADGRAQTGSRRRVFRRFEHVGVATIADRGDIPGPAKVQPPGGFGVFFGLGEQRVRGATGQPLRRDMRLALGEGHVFVKVKPVRGVDDPRHPGACGSHSTDKGCGRCVDMYQIEVFPCKEFPQRDARTHVAERIDGSDEGHGFNAEPFGANRIDQITFSTDTNNLVPLGGHGVHEGAQEMVEGEIHRAELADFQDDPLDVSVRMALTGSRGRCICCGRDGDHHHQAERGHPPALPDSKSQLSNCKGAGGGRNQRG